MYLPFFIFALLSLCCSAFALQPLRTVTRGRGDATPSLTLALTLTLTPSLLCTRGNTGFETDSQPERAGEGRIPAVVKTAGKVGLAAMSSLLLNTRSNAATPGERIVVLGSNGKTGALTVKYLAKQGVAVIPTNRGGNANEAFKDFIVGETVAADVTKPETLEAAITGASAVVFAASASRKGGSANQVDNQGVANVAAECIRLKVPRLVVISSGAITKPDSLGFKITNLFGNIMNEKLSGENKLRELYAASGAGDLSYVIIRPGGLLDNDAAGPTGLTLNQGDTISGEVNRADVAQCAAAAALSKTLPSKVTFEVYETGRSGPLEGKYKDISGYERSGSTFDEMFKGLASGDVVVAPKSK